MGQGKHARAESIENNGGSAVKKHKGEGWYTDTCVDIETGKPYWRHTDRRLSYINPHLEGYSSYDEKSDAIGDDEDDEDDETVDDLKQKKNRTSRKPDVFPCPSTEDDAHCPECADPLPLNGENVESPDQRPYCCPICNEWYHVKCLRKITGEPRIYMPKTGTSCHRCESKSGKSNTTKKPHVEKKKQCAVSSSSYSPSSAFDKVHPDLIDPFRQIAAAFATATKSRLEIDRLHQRINEIEPNLTEALRDREDFKKEIEKLTTQKNELDNLLTVRTEERADLAFELKELKETYSKDMLIQARRVGELETGMVAFDKFAKLDPEEIAILKCMIELMPSLRDESFDMEFFKMIIPKMVGISKKNKRVCKSALFEEEDD